MIEQLSGSKINFQGSILGFAEYHEFELSIIEDQQYAYLQCVDHEDIGFLVVNPFAFNTEFSFELQENDKQALKIEKQDEVLVVAIMTIQEPFESSTMNLLAPLVINIHNKLGRQCILPPNSPFGTKEPLISQIKVESGE
ncbi:flagellar assembly protein FliW [Cohnella endophytica]|uniref:Flagellar assembly factor FliW n=1 Tax=Cohnella endophytica TaxID=2419778 RepID=A0A494X975_9BACL|nr:flagellar assembly protein FliW [Cohnella endophytica]RKP47255.1 flagellar assembly protein FliW [Cohnella endophytica]